ncbi:hypothetical protein RMO59_38215, partial [Streptomyces alfalfae]
MTAPMAGDGITRLDAAGLLGHADGLAGLLVATVRDGASLGFLADLDRATAAAWWRGLAGAVEAGGVAAVSLKHLPGQETVLNVGCPRVVEKKTTRLIKKVNCELVNRTR